MPIYKAPLRDIRFVLHELLKLESHCTTLGREDVTTELVDSILDEGARFTENVVAPLNAPGDEASVQYAAGEVRTPRGFREAYQQFCADGWASIVAPVEYGGQGLPASAELPLSEMLASGNLAWRTYSGLTIGATLAIERHATQALKERYLGKLSNGQWAGTMCLTESQCGTDLGLIRTRALPCSDGSYSISGTKIFITGGEHDLCENIVHLVLAKLADAPEGSKGISLFLVPKFLPDPAGNIGERNAVICASVEHKMGIRGSATCVLNFADAKGWLIGAPNSGLACMFTMMNHARIGVGVQGLGLAELAFQGSLSYARERLQGRAPTPAGRTDKPADPIIVHPDVRRMLMTQKALIEGSRMLAYFAATQMDIGHDDPDSQARLTANDLLALLTPIIKAFLTEVAVESASLGIQIHGGHGYIHETGMEQILRDARILPIYEGTNGVQALDLLGRKVLGSRGELLKCMAGIIVEFCGSHGEDIALKPFTAALASLVREWSELTQWIGAAAQRDPNEIGAASVDYLQFAGYVCLAWCWARAAAVAHDAIENGAAEPDFYQAKIGTAHFYFERVLPRTRAHADAIRAGAGSTMSLDAAHFAF